MLIMMLMVKAIFKKELLYLWRYRINTIATIVFMSVICVGITSTSEFTNVTQILGGSKLSMIAPYFLWLVMTTNFNSITGSISSDSTSGIMEQLYVNSGNYFKILIIRAVSSFILNIIPLYTIIFIISFFAEINILSFFIVIPVFILGVPAIWGLALMAGALTLRYKQVTSVVSIFSTILFMGISFFLTKIDILAYIMPFAKANKISLLIIQQIDYNIVIADIATIIINGAIFFAIGIICFKFAEKSAKKIGNLGMH